MGKSFLLCGFFAGLMLLSCSARPIKSGQLAPKEEGVTPEVITSRQISGGIDASAVKDLKILNEKAKKPSFGLIGGFYQLPESSPLGAVEISSATSFGQSYTSVRLESGGSPFAVVPASASQSKVFERTMQKLLDADVRMREISMADALVVMKAEQKAIEKKKVFLLKQSLPSGVDLLISIQRGESEEGPVFFGRVIGTKDGRLWAFASEPDIGAYGLEPLILRLVKDSLKRIGENK